MSVSSTWKKNPLAPLPKLPLPPHFEDGLDVNTAEVGSDIKVCERVIDADVWVTVVVIIVRLVVFLLSLVVPFAVPLKHSWSEGFLLMLTTLLGDTYQDQHSYFFVFPFCHLIYTNCSWNPISKTSYTHNTSCTKPNILNLIFSFSIYKLWLKLEESTQNTVTRSHLNF